MRRARGSRGASRCRGRARAPACALAAGLLAGAAACSPPEDPGARLSVREATITAEVRSRILAAAGLAPLPLAVETRAGTVRVRGTVRDSSQIAAVDTIARRVRGVERVQLELRIEPAPEPDTASTRRRSDSIPADARVSAPPDTSPR